MGTSKTETTTKECRFSKALIAIECGEKLSAQSSNPGMTIALAFAVHQDAIKQALSWAATLERAGYNQDTINDMEHYLKIFGTFCVTVQPVPPNTNNGEE